MSDPGVLTLSLVLYSVIFDPRVVCIMDRPFPLTSVYRCSSQYPFWVISLYSVMLFNYVFFGLLFFLVDFLEWSFSKYLCLWHGQNSAVSRFSHFLTTFCRTPSLVDFFVLSTILVESVLMFSFQMLLYCDLSYFFTVQPSQQQVMPWVLVTDF